MSAELQQKKLGHNQQNRESGRSRGLNSTATREKMALWGVVGQIEHLNHVLAQPYSKCLAAV